MIFSKNEINTLMNIKEYWRPIAAVIYLGLNVIDYAIRPIVNYVASQHIDITHIIFAIRGLNPAVQVKTIELLIQSASLQPILPEFFHVAFGAILGAAAFTRGLEKVATIKKSAKSE